MEQLRQQIASLTRTNEENTHRIGEFDSQKFNFEHEITEKDRQILEREEKLQELQSNLEKTQESSAKLRKALHKMKETITNNEQTHNQESGRILLKKSKSSSCFLEIRLRMIAEEHEEKLREKEGEYSANLKSITKQLTSQMEEKEQEFNRQLQELISKISKQKIGVKGFLFVDKSYQIEHDIKQRFAEAEQRAQTAEEQLRVR